VYAGFRQVDQQNLNYSMTLSGSEAVSLLQMTPFAWRAREEVWQNLAASSEFNCDADFMLTLWQRD